MVNLNKLILILMLAMISANVFAGTKVLWQSRYGGIARAPDGRFVSIPGLQDLLNEAAIQNAVESYEQGVVKSRLNTTVPLGNKKIPLTLTRSVGAAGLAKAVLPLVKLSGPLALASMALSVADLIWNDVDQDWEVNQDGAIVDKILDDTMIGNCYTGPITPKVNKNSVSMLWCSNWASANLVNPTGFYTVATNTFCLDSQSYNTSTGKWTYVLRTMCFTAGSPRYVCPDGSGAINADSCQYPATLVPASEDLIQTKVADAITPKIANGDTKVMDYINQNNLPISDVTDALSGPSTYPGESSTVTESSIDPSNPDLRTDTTTTTDTTYSAQYVGDNVNYSEAKTVTVNNTTYNTATNTIVNTNTSTDTTTTETIQTGNDITTTRITTQTPDITRPTITTTKTEVVTQSTPDPVAPVINIPEFKTDCDKYPNTLGCADPVTIIGAPPTNPTLKDYTVPFTVTKFTVNSDAQCPAPVTFTLSKYGAYDLSYQPLCDFASMLKPLTVAIGLFIAFSIVSGSVRSGGVA